MGDLSRKSESASAFDNLTPESRLALAQICAESGNAQSLAATLRAEDLCPAEMEGALFAATAHRRAGTLMKGYARGQARQRDPHLGEELRCALEAAASLAESRSLSEGSAMRRILSEQALQEAKALDADWFESWALGPRGEEPEIEDLISAAAEQFGKGANPQTWARALGKRGESGAAALFQIGARLVKRRSEPRSPEDLREESLAEAARVALRWFGSDAIAPRWAEEMGERIYASGRGGYKEERGKMLREILGEIRPEEGSRIWGIAGSVALRESDPELFELAKIGGREKAGEIAREELEEEWGESRREWELPPLGELRALALLSLSPATRTLGEETARRWLRADPPRGEADRIALLECLARGGWSEAAEATAEPGDWAALALARPHLMSDLLALDHRKLSPSGVKIAKGAPIAGYWQERVLYFAKRLEAAGARTRQSGSRLASRAPEMAAFIEASRLRARKFQESAAPAKRPRGI